MSKEAKPADLRAKTPDEKTIMAQKSNSSAAVK